MDYGPVAPLSDPVEHAQLVELLRGGGLVPVDASFWPFTHTEIRLEVSPPTDDWYFIEGITSTMQPGLIRLRQIQLQERTVLHDIDAGSFNLGHLVPIALGCFSRTHPLTIVSEVVVSEEMPELRLTLWCRVSAGWVAPPPAPRVPIVAAVCKPEDPPPAWSSWSPGPISDALRRAPSSTMLKALRLLKDNDVEITDDELRALMDHCAPLL